MLFCTQFAHIVGLQVSALLRRRQFQFHFLTKDALITFSVKLSPEKKGFFAFYFHFPQSIGTEVDPLHARHFTLEIDYLEILCKFSSRINK